MPHQSHSRHRRVPAIAGRLSASLVTIIFSLTLTAHAQWDIQQSHTTASLRGIQNLGNGVVWASGTRGTVLRTTDGGANWQRCATPPDAEKLDFRGIQAFDANTAIVMSSGTGDLSRLYKTADACKTWSLLFTNPNKEGFWDAIQFTGKAHGFLLGDPVSSPGDAEPHTFLRETFDGGLHWIDWHESPSALVFPGPPAFFAASNTSMIANPHGVILGGGGGDRASLIAISRSGYGGSCNCLPPTTPNQAVTRTEVDPIASGDSSGIFSIAQNERGLMLVGGDYKKPDSTYKAALFLRSDLFPIQPDTPPHGFRSAVAYDARQKLWVTVGPNGTDISTDDGLNWTPLKPSPSDQPGADKNWNALSLPFVVGSRGRIGKLRPIHPASRPAKSK